MDAALVQVGRHGLRLAHGAVGALGTRVADDLSAPRLEQLAALDGHVVRQHHLEVVAPHLGDHGERDAGVAG